MKIDSINVDATIKKVEKILDEEQGLSPALRSAIELLIVLVTLLVNRLNLDSRTSSKPPSSDPNRKRKKKTKTGNNRGGQKGHVGTTLKQVDDPDEIEVLTIDKRTLPRGEYEECGFETRQVIDIEISQFVTEYRAQVLKNQDGARFVAECPAHVARPVQYGANLKAHAVYMSQFQLIPYNRIQDYFAEQMQIPVSSGSIHNFNREAFERLQYFESVARDELARSDVLHADETGINVDGKRLWLHCASNSR